MAVLASSHPDIAAFINAKNRGGLKNFNLSVGFDARFFHCLDRGVPRDPELERVIEEKQTGVTIP